MDLQRLTLFGRATRDAEMIEAKNGGKNFAKIGVAVNRYTGSGEDKEREATFYDCLIFGEKQIERAMDKIKKGDLITLEGRPEADAYIDKNGEAKASLVVLVNGWQVLK